jgi:hypothetical protein
MRYVKDLVGLAIFLVGAYALTVMLWAAVPDPFYK